MQEQQSVVAINIIATNKYKVFVTPLLQSIDKYFLKDHLLISIHLFTDELLKNDKWGRCFVRQRLIPSYKWPYATLYRYKIFMEAQDMMEEFFQYYIDADMLINDFVGEEILNEITVVHHAGFYRNNSWGSPNVDERSTAYLEPENRKEYMAGGFSGACTKEFIKICNILSHNISIDEENGVMAEWHDESHANKLYSTMEDRSKLTILPPSYCMPQQERLQKLWGIYDLPKKILALEKQHELIRN